MQIISIAMSNLFDLKIRSLMVFALAIFLTAVGSFASSSTSGGPALCSRVHSPYTLFKVREDWKSLIPMDPKYRGEDQGLYMDPVTKHSWSVKYYTESEKQEYELFVKNGVFVDRAGNKRESEFDGDSNQFHQGLFVIDADKRIFFLPFEERGKYHHSSLTSGKPVLFAGTVSLVAGRLRELTNESGHYKPDLLQTLIAIRILHLMGLDMKAMKLEGRVAKTLGSTYSMNPDEVRAALGILFENQPLSLNEIQSLIPAADRQ